MEQIHGHIDSFFTRNTPILEKSSKHVAVFELVKGKEHDSFK